MKNKQPAKSNAIVLSQLCKLIPQHLVAKIARKYGIDKQARTFSPWSHFVGLFYAQLTHAIGLNDVCDGLTHHAAQLATIRGATPPAKNTLSQPPTRWAYRPVIKAARVGVQKQSTWKSVSCTPSWPDGPCEVF